MKLRLITALCLSALFANPLFAGGAEVLTSVPGEAVGFVCIPDPGELDADVKSAIESLGFGGMVPLPDNSMLTMAQAQLPALKGLDREQPMIVAIMPGDDVENMDDTQVVMIPTKDPEAMLKDLNGSESGDHWTINIMGKSLVADAESNYVLIADRAEILDQVEASEGTMDKLLSSDVAGGMADLDVVIGLNVQALSSLITPWLEANLYPMLDAQASSDLEKDQMALQKKQIAKLLNGLNSMLIGIRMEDNALALRVVLGAKDGSELAKSMHVAVSSDSMLDGLPGGDWVLAGGQVMDLAQAKVQATNLDEMFSAYENAEGVDAAAMADLKSSLSRWMEISRGYRMSVSAAEGGDGVIAATMIAKAENSEEWLKLTKQSFDKAKALLDGLGDDLSEILDTMSMADADGGLNLKIDLSGLSKLDEDELEMIENIVGSDMSFEMKAVNDTDVLIYFGGEPAAASSSEAENAGINALADFLPTERNSVNYIFVDEAIELARKVLIAIDEDDLPFVTPEIEAPIAITATDGENWSMVDFVIPMEVIEAGRDIGMTMMGRQ